jgi:hypothetical protein
MRPFHLLAAFSLLSAGLALAPEAHAAKKTDTVDPCKMESPTITKSGISDMDQVFDKAGNIQTTVRDQTSSVCTARGHLNDALGVGTDAPVATALADLKTKAGGKIKMAMNGTMPKLEASDVPDNVQKAVDAVNELINSSSTAATQTAGLLPEAKALATQAAGFPMKVPTMKVDNVDIPTAIKVVGENVKAIKQLPNQIEALGGQLELVVTDVKSTFGM